MGEVHLEENPGEVREPTHVPVLLEEVVAGLQVKANGCYLDATVGLGGHCQAILSEASGVRAIAIDRDGEVLERAQKNLAEFGDRIAFWQGNFADYQPGDWKFDGIVADLGVSSLQLDRAERGFSFRRDAPLDMRMDRTQELRAEDIVNFWQERQLADIFFTCGEERYARRIARHIVRQRPFRMTVELAEAIARCVPKAYRYGRIHPATRTFQALRVAVNQEIKALEQFLERAPYWLVPGGRIAIVSFHSLEDRLVKHRTRENPCLRAIARKPILPSDAERQRNPRSRSAKLRVAERLADRAI